tara:strand:+ start:548 stop:799 length:252 start_codon:yes stop_codon:yes gene_type:complete
MDLIKDRERGARAQAVLNEPIVLEAFNTIRNLYFDAWRNSNAAEQREHLYCLFTAIDEFQGHLENVLKTGQMAEKELFNNKRS